MTAIGQAASKRQQRVCSFSGGTFESKERSFIQTAEHIKEALFAIFSRVFVVHYRRYDMELVYMDSVVHYRLRGYGWNRFVIENDLKDAMAAAKQMGRKLEVEGWAFRSKELGPNGGAEADGHHPDGALGFAILVKDIEA
jgi:hypothetical protein